ncbi:PDR/VanB family oxidoreductase [Marinomonas sp.]|nr:PDR/VanB family oxidoreductase [Marinomonas sp.]MDB4836863.1 PDR/VanB family oxidoreductase [Marinomonas sp.]
MQKGLIKAIVKKREQLADAVVMLELVRSDGNPFPIFSAGAHIDVHLSSGLVRQYSLCGDPAELNSYRLGVLKAPDSRGGSNEVHSTLLEGTEVLISEPRSLFPLVESAERSILIGGGIGITPILSMAYELHYIGSEFELLYCGRSRQSSGFVEELEGSSFSSRIKMHFDLEHQNQFVNLDEIFTSVDLNTHLYVCGPANFIDWVIDYARSIGMQNEQIHKEFFSVDVDGTGGEFEVVASKSGVTVQVKENQSISEALIAAGLDVDVSCEQGVCGTCLCDVIEGIPEHRDVYLTDEEKQDNDQMTLCCSRSLSSQLILDI